MIPVMADYFRTMGTRILYGREFTDAEIHSGARVAVVNQRFAAGFGAPQDAIGHQLTNEGDNWRIIGVVKGMEYETDPTTAHGNEVFVPSTNPGSFFSTFVVRVAGRAEDRLAEVRDAIQSVDPQVPVFGAKTMKQRLDDTFAGPKFYRTAVSFALRRIRTAVSSDRYLRHRVLCGYPEDAGNGDTVSVGYNSGPTPWRAIAAGTADGCGQRDSGNRRSATFGAPSRIPDRRGEANWLGNVDRTNFAARSCRIHQYLVRESSHCKIRCHRHTAFGITRKP